MSQSYNNVIQAAQTNLHNNDEHVYTPISNPHSKTYEILVPRPEKDNFYAELQKNRNDIDGIDVTPVATGQAIATSAVVSPTTTPQNGNLFSTGNPTGVLSSTSQSDYDEIPAVQTNSHNNDKHVNLPIPNPLNENLYQSLTN